MAVTGWAMLTRVRVTPGTAPSVPVLTVAVRPPPGSVTLASTGDTRVYTTGRLATGPAGEKLCSWETSGGDEAVPGVTVKTESVTISVSARGTTLNDRRLDPSRPAKACTRPGPG